MTHAPDDEGASLCTQEGVVGEGRTDCHECLGILRYERQQRLRQEAAEREVARILTMRQKKLEKRIQRANERRTERI